MKRKSELRIVRPTNAELNILRALWRLGPSTVRHVHEELSQDDRNLGYTTVLKFLQIMLDKGLVKREDSQRAHVYRPAVSREQTQRQLTRQLIDGAFDGSRSQLVLQALSGADRVRPEELAEIRALLDRLQGTQNN
ncbi:MAG TPA: BlaI/MecI/CopY family transcriptional regulator [Steroidobacteraceae bacterium]